MASYPKLRRTSAPTWLFRKERGQATARPERWGREAVNTEFYREMLKVIAEKPAGFLVKLGVILS